MSENNIKGVAVAKAVGVGTASVSHAKTGKIKVPETWINDLNRVFGKELVDKYLEKGYANEELLDKLNEDTPVYGDKTTLNDRERIDKLFNSLESLTKAVLEKTSNEARMLELMNKLVTRHTVTS